MSSYKELIGSFLIAASFAMLADAMPEDAKDQGPSLFGLPFLQLTNGGIRVNFGGYHAEAGLGGLLTGSRTGGGLHASAGTPWGAQAAAGLGGNLGGDDATAGGGLYARAGLGQGLPEARAALGGQLDGSGRSAVPISGGLYAGATAGENLLKFGAETSGAGTDDDRSDQGDGADGGRKGSSSASSAATAPSATTSSRKPNNGRTYIQILQKAETTDSGRNESEKYPKNTELRREVDRSRVPGPVVLGAEAGLAGALFANGGVEKVKFKNGGFGFGQIESLSAVTPPSPQQPSRIPALIPRENDVLTTVKEAADGAAGRRRFYFKKRFWRAPARKQLIYHYEHDADPEAQNN